MNWTVGRRVLELGRNESGLGVSDGAARRQRQGQVAVGERGNDRRLRCWRRQDRLTGADGDANGARKLLPELADRGMGIAPLPDDRPDLVVAARIIGHDAAPGANGSAESGCQFGALAELAFRRANFCVRRLAQHLAGNHAVGFERGVAGSLVSLVGNQLPSFAG
jgi:hypothetical protein